MKSGDGLIDEEWVILIQAAKELGLTPEEVREFFYEHAKAQVDRVAD
ncbi:anti-repressor SinI family protein [Cytobacillus gottheilii]|nr:anti-repressor SinI family protein [Cytobacillus gottheilii]